MQWCRTQTSISSAFITDDTLIPKKHKNVALLRWKGDSICSLIIIGLVGSLILIMINLKVKDEPRKWLTDCGFGQWVCMQTERRGWEGLYLESTNTWPLPPVLWATVGLKLGLMGDSEKKPSQTRGTAEDERLRKTERSVHLVLPLTFPFYNLCFDILYPFTWQDWLWTAMLMILPPFQEAVVHINFPQSLPPLWWLVSVSSACWQQAWIIHSFKWNKYHNPALEQHILQSRGQGGLRA